MHITFHPIRHDETLRIARRGDSLIVNDQEIALQGYQAGTCLWILGSPELIDGTWHLALLLPHGARAPEATRFPQPVVAADDGPIPVPVHDLPD